MSTPPALRRRLPDLASLSELMKFSAPRFGTDARLAKASTIWDLREIAKRRTPTAAFDYTDGAAEAEITINRAREAFRALEFKPDVLRDVSEVDLSTEILGGSSSLPVGIAPTGFARLMQSEGEYAGSAAAAKAGIPFTLSTLGTASAEQVATHCPDGRRWFQLYATSDQGKNLELVQRAADHGYDTIMLTVDTAVGGMRLRDARNGMTIPPQLTVKTILDASYRPAWWFNFLSRSPLEFASLSSFEGTVSELLSKTFNQGLNYDDLDWLRSNWSGKLLVKGIQTVADSERAVAHGADGVVLSNHGGRQLDRAPLPFHLVPAVRAALGKEPTIVMDTGIMSGGDIIAAIASGADFTLVGRAYLYGLMAGGQRGVERSIEILRSEMLRTMKLLGVTRLSDLTPEHVNQRADLS